MLKRTTKGFLTALILAGAWLAMPAAQAADKDLVLKGDAKCTSCHDESDGPELLRIGKTKHGTRADGRTPTCVSCHGESDKHVNKPDSVQDRPPVDRSYSKKSKLTADEKSATCTGCHKGGKHMNWNSSAHATRDVACTSCHKVHDGHDKVRDKKTQAEVCYTCHKTQRAELNRPSHHPIPEGKMTCSDCHNAHGSAGQKALVKDTTNATCFTCHAEKRGPFVHNHNPVQEDCGICHNPHGTTTTGLLKVRPPFLCQQCHEATSHRGNMPSATKGAIADEKGIGVILGLGCVSCHQPHGTNNPKSSSSLRN